MVVCNLGRAGRATGFGPIRGFSGKALCRLRRCLELGLCDCIPVFLGQRYVVDEHIYIYMYAYTCAYIYIYMRTCF